MMRPTAVDEQDLRRRMQALPNGKVPPKRG